LCACLGSTFGLQYLLEGIQHLLLFSIDVLQTANESMPLGICDLSGNDLGDLAVAAILRVCEVRNDINNKATPLEQVNLSGNNITRIGQLWIATYLNEITGQCLILC
jgi:hypothetical protein